MPKCKFPNQTRDAIEILYWESILGNFPTYRDFWEKFIGVRVERIESRLRPYKLILPIALNSKRDLIDDLHEKICMIHYACFCQLASARFELQQLIDSSQILDPHERHFKHWQAFEAGYLHLGAAWQEIKLLWKYICEHFKNLDSSSTKNYPIREYFKNIDPSLHTNLAKMQSEIISFRNDIAHFARRVNRPIGNSYEVPLDFAQNASWTKQITTSNWIKTEKKLEEDIVTCEKTFDATHRFLIREFKNALTLHNIRIDYKSGQVDEACPRCKWWMETILKDESGSTKGNQPQADSSSSERYWVRFSHGSSTATIGSSSVAPTTFEQAYKNDGSSFLMSPKAVKRCRNPKCGHEV